MNCQTKPTHILNSHFNIIFSKISFVKIEPFCSLGRGGEMRFSFCLQLINLILHRNAMIEFVSFESDVEKFMSDILKTIASRGSFCG